MCDGTFAQRALHVCLQRDSNLDGSIAGSLGSLERLEHLAQRIVMRDDRLDVNLTRCHKRQRSGIGIGIAEDATNVDLTSGRIDDRQADNRRSQADQHDDTARLGRL